MDQTIRDLFTEAEWEVFAEDAASTLVAIESLPVHMGEVADEDQ